MTSWERAIAFTLAYEGGYDNDPNDRGGETFRGISRRNWPDWPGWAVVDAAKRDTPAIFEAVLLANLALRTLVVDFYKNNFWDPIHGDELPGKVSAAAFDFAVNSGVKPAIRLLQSSVGVFVDGVVGPKTVKASYDAGESGLVTYLAARAKYLQGIMDNDPTQEVWAMNWFRRLFKLANMVLEGEGAEFTETNIGAGLPSHAD